MRGSPSVRKRIVDKSERVEAPSGTKGAIVLISDRGPCNQRVTITQSSRFRFLFGNEDGVHMGHYAAQMYLKRGSVLEVVREVPTSGGAQYGGVRWPAEGSYIPTALVAGLSDDGEGEPDVSGFTFAGDELLLITAANPGAWNANVCVTVDKVDASDDTFYITVYEKDDDGNWQEAESPWLCSRVKTKKSGYGNSLYVETVINGNSDYIWVHDNDLVAGTTEPMEYTTEIAFGSGANGTDPTHSNLATAWDTYFLNEDAVAVNVLIAGGYTNTDGATDEIAAKLISIAESRLDCVAAVDIPYSKTVAQARTWRAAVGVGTSAFLGNLYYNWAKIHCTYTDEIVYVPPSGVAAAVYAYCDDIDSPWAAPAGTNRALLAGLGVIGVERELSKGERDLLYEDEINFLRSKVGKGVYIDGQRTMQTKRSSLSETRAVRGLVSTMPGIGNFLLDFLEEPNNEFTRLRVETGIRAVFRPLVGVQLDSYDVVCNTDNNPEAVRDAQRLVVDGFVKITPTAEQIEFSAVVVRAESVLLSY